MDIMKRAKGLWGTGTVAAGVGAIGDFFSPIGGYFLPIAAAVVAFSFATYLLFKRDVASVKPVARWSMHAVHVFLVFAAVTAAIGFKSFMLSPQGGILGASVPAVSDLQESIGLLRENLKMQRETRDAVNELSSTVKKESSDNPRKELANRGIAWNEESFAEALDTQDTETIDLFLRGRFNIIGSKFLKARIARIYFSENFSEYRKTLEQLHAGGFDFVSSYADDLDRLNQDEYSYKSAPLINNTVFYAMWESNLEAAHWLVSHGDKSRLTSFGQVLAKYLENCPEGEDGLAVASFLIKEGVPVEKSIAAVSDSRQGPNSVQCRRVMKMLRP